MTALFANNATSRIPDDLGSGSTSLLVWPGDGAKFPQPGAGDFFTVTLEDRRTGQIEICTCTSRSGDMLQLVRAQEGTVAQNFLMGASVSNRMTAAVLANFFTYGWSRQESDDRYVNITGDTMTGELSVPLLPSAPAHATSKDYVDYQISLIAGIAEPPNDGKDYARHYQSWTLTISKTTFDSNVARIDAKDAQQDLQIGQNTIDIATNRANIATNTTNIAENTADIATNQSEIAAIQSVNGSQDVLISQLQTNKVNKAGDTMTGPLVVPGPPTANGQAANKKYVDDQLGSVNQFPEAPLDGRQYARYMAGWQKVAVVGTTSTGDKPPTALLEPGQMWFETDTGSLFIWYDDGNTTQWVQINTAQRSVGDVPVGTVVDYAGDTAPTGWMMCFGQAMSRVLYSTLFQKIGVYYGAGDGVNTFNLPDCRDRTAVGKGDMGGSAANRITVALSGFDSKVLGGAGGSEGIILGLTQIPAHAHTGGTGNNNVDHSHTFSTTTGYVSGDHSHSFNVNTGGENVDHAHTYWDQHYTGNIASNGTGSGGAAKNAIADDARGTAGRNAGHIHNVAGGTGGISANHTHALSGTTAGQNTTHAHTITSEGGGLAHPNLQPTIVFNKIIKV
jgi:microcystin-dependent protein